MGKDTPGYEYSSSTAWKRLIQSIPPTYTVWYDAANAVYRAENSVAGGTDLSDPTISTVLQGACDALTSGGTVLVKRGTYTNVNVPVTTPHVHLIGEPGTIFANVNPHDYFFYVRADDFTADGITFNVVDAATIFYMGTWNVESTVENFTIQNCEFTGLIEDVVYPSNKVVVNNFVAKNNHWHDITTTGLGGQGGALWLGYAAAYPWHNITILNNLSENCASYDTFFRVNFGHNVTIANNRFYNLDRTIDYKYGIQLHPAWSASVTGNTFEWDADPTALTGAIEASYDGTTCSEDVAITGNTIRGDAALPHMRVGIYVHGVSNADRCQRATVTGNTVRGMQAGIQFTYAYDVAATGNVVKDSRDQGLGFATVTRGLAGDNIVVNSNRDAHAAGFDATGIPLGTSSHIRVLGNTVYDETPRQHYAIYELNDCSDNVIKDNEVYGAVTGPVIYALSDAIVKGNKGHVTEATGTSTGTGAQQTIAHGCAFTPTTANVILSDIEVGAAPYCSAAPDAANIYVWAVINQDYRWEVKQYP